MLDEMRVNDVQLNASDIRQLEGADEIAHFFAKLRYDVDERTNISDYGVLGMASADMCQHIHKIELIGKHPVDGDICIYLFEVRSVTAKLRNDIARRFRERPENAILVLTQEYEELEFVLLERVVSRSQSRCAALKQAIRPIPLTVSRLHPDPIALRVLKCFTYTEEDATYRWEKLRSAYMLAEWSEEYFVEGEIQREYEKSLETLIPIKRDLACTDALNDKIVYRLYGLTDEEVELIERPQYEQALTDAKAQVVADEAITDDEKKIEKIAEGILPAACGFFERVEPTAVEELLDSELSNWRSLPPEAPTFPVTGDYNLRILPDHMDFSTSVIPYTKAVEVVLSQRIFIPFCQHYTHADRQNDFLKKFMRGEKDLTLGSFMIILSSSGETALRNFISRMYPGAATHVFRAQGLVAILNDEERRDIRNKAAHDEALSRDESQQTRTWAMRLIGQV